VYESSSTAFSVALLGVSQSCCKAVRVGRASGSRGNLCQWWTLPVVNAKWVCSFTFTRAPYEAAKTVVVDISKFLSPRDPDR
jgi:hypothetical protein